MMLGGTVFNDLKVCIVGLQIETEMRLVCLSRERQEAGTRRHEKSFGQLGHVNSFGNCLARASLRLTCNEILWRFFPRFSRGFLRGIRHSERAHLRLPCGMMTNSTHPRPQPTQGYLTT